jgi:hypothetical protein
MGYYNTFVVRIWCNDSRKLNRGYVQHVSSQEQRYFLAMDDLTDFILGHLIPPAHDSGTGDQTLGNHALAENLGGVLEDGEEL